MSQWASLKAAGTGKTIALFVVYVIFTISGCFLRVKLKKKNEAPDVEEEAEKEE